MRKLHPGVAQIAPPSGPALPRPDPWLPAIASGSAGKQPHTSGASASVAVAAASCSAAYFRFWRPHMPSVRKTCGSRSRNANYKTGNKQACFEFVSRLCVLCSGLRGRVRPGSKPQDPVPSTTLAAPGRARCPAAREAQRLRSSRETVLSQQLACWSGRLTNLALYRFTPLRVSTPPPMEPPAVRDGCARACHKEGARQQATASDGNHGLLVVKCLLAAASRH